VARSDFGATIETFYQYSWNRAPDRNLLLRAYDTRANTFGLQQAAFVIDAAPDVEAGRRFGARVDLQFGMATDTVHGNPANEPRPEAYRHLWQMYGTYVLPVGPTGLQVDAGKYASMLGYETNYAKDNQAFSRAYLFNFLPFYHSGVRLTLPVTDGVSLLFMLSNGIQQTEDFNDFKSNHFAAVLKPTRRVTWVVNYYFGQEQPDGGEPDCPNGYFRVFDTNVAFAATPRLALALDLNHVTNELTTDEPSTVVLRPAPVRRSQIAKPISLRPAKTPSTKWISASASFPGGLPLSFGMIFTTVFCGATTAAFVFMMFSSEPRVCGFLRDLRNSSAR
jgi:hypothetical protein